MQDGGIGYGAAYLYGILCGVFPTLDRKPPRPSPTSVWVKSYVRYDGTRVLGYWEECKDINLKGHFYKCWVVERNKQTFIWKAHLEKNRIIPSPVTPKASSQKVCAKSGNAQEITITYKPTDAGSIDNNKRLEDGQTYWRRILIEKHKVVPPPTADISVLIKVEGELDKAMKSGVDFKLPDGWSKTIELHEED